MHRSGSRNALGNKIGEFQATAKAPPTANLNPNRGGVLSRVTSIGFMGCQLPKTNSFHMNL
jgi:hypothetical protein